MAQRIPLRAYRIAPRKPWLAVDGTDLVVRVPGWWAGRSWRVPLSDVGVTPADLLPDEPPHDEDAVFAEPIVIPFVYTTGPAVGPNVALVFRQPVAVPRFHPVARSQLSEEIPVRGARGDRPKGRYVDGLLVRAVDPTTAVETLVAAGAERVADPDAWLMSRRPRAAPEHAAWLRRSEQRVRLAQRVAIGAAVGATGALLAFEGRAWGDPVAATVGLVAAGAFATSSWMERRMLRGRRD